MDIEKLQKGLSFLSTSPPVTKVIISAVLFGIVLFVLVTMWLPPPETAITETMLPKCYTRALFTRMHAQLSTDAMFASIDECRKTVESSIPDIHNKNLRSTAVDLLATIDAILRKKPQDNKFLGMEDMRQIDQLKLRALNGFLVLARATGGNYELPDAGHLAESVYFTKDEASKAPDANEIASGNLLNSLN